MYPPDFHQYLGTPVETPEQIRYYLGWAVVSVAKVIENATEAGTTVTWEVLPALLNDAWHTSAWYDQHPRLSQLYDAAFAAGQHDQPAVLFAREHEQPGPRALDVIEGILRQSVEPAGYPEDGYPEDGYPEDGYPEDGYPEAGDSETGEAALPPAEQVWGAADASGDPGVVATDEGVGDLTPEEAERLPAVLALVADDDADDISESDQEIYAIASQLPRYRDLFRSYGL